MGTGCLAGYTCRNSVTAMVKELPKSWAAIGSSGLLSINGVQWLVDEET